MRLEDVRGHAPLTDRAAYEAAYREAELSGSLAELVHRLRSSTNLGTAELAERMGVPATDVSDVEDGSAALGLVDFLDRLGRVVGEEGELRIGAERVLFGHRPQIPRAAPPAHDPAPAAHDPATPAHDPAPAPPGEDEDGATNLWASREE